MARVEGAEHLDTARAGGKGTMLITAHVTCLEMGGRINCLAAPETHPVYRPLRSPVLEWYQNRSRESYAAAAIRNRDTRGILRALRRNEAIWYAPDQDFGADRSVFAPFFGIETATLEATVRLVEGAHIAGRVVDAEGEAVADVEKGLGPIEPHGCPEAAVELDDDRCDG